MPKNNDVSLRDFEESDIPLMTLYANNEKVSVNLRDAFPHPYTEADAEKFLKMVMAQNPRTFFAIEYLGEYVGNISLLRGTDVYRNSAEIGYFIGEPFWNKGIMSTAVNLICDFGFNSLGVVRIHTGVFEFNQASQRVLEKCGFIKEGIFSKAITKNEKIYDEIRYAIVQVEEDE